MQDGISKLIGEFYEGAYDVERWNATVEELCRLLDVKWMMIAPFDENNRIPLRPEFHRVPNSRFSEGIADYSEAMFRLDPTNVFAALNHSGGVFQSSQGMHADDYLKDEYVRWNRANLGSTFWQLRYAGRGGLKFGVSLHRSEQSGPLSDRETDIFADVFHHMAKAVRLASRPADLTGSDPLIAIDRLGYVIATNGPADALLQAGDAIRLRGRSLSASSPRGGATLADAIRQVIAGVDPPSSGRSFFLERDKAAPLVLTVEALPDKGAPLQTLHAAATIRIVDPGETPEIRTDWRALFGFTPAECRLAKTLLQSDGTLRNLADELGVAYATARVQLANVFEKAGVKSQSQLIKLLMRIGSYVFAVVAGPWNPESVLSVI